MATAAVSAAATRVSNLLAEEAKFLCGVEDQIKQLQRELEWMQSFLKDADKRQAEDERVRKWILEIRDLAYDVEDVIETFALKIAPMRRSGCANAVKRATCIFKEACNLHKVKSQIEEITKRINESTRRLQTYGVRQLGDDQESASSSRARRREERRSYPHLVQENVVGLDDEIQKLTSILMAEGEEEYRAVSIFGMGGIGKTTLAKKVYNKHQLKSHFDCFAWIYVSQQCEQKNVWAGILSSVDPTFDLRGKDMRLMDPQDLSSRLYHFLKDKRYLVVLDDVWNTRDWDDLRPGFPMEGHGGKVLVTSRYKDVAEHIDPRVYEHEMKCLNENDGLELFRKISLSKRHPTDFVIDDKLGELEKKMVGYCKGLPLAISVIGGILATKDRTYHNWKMVHDNIGSYFKKANVLTVHDSLSLSYEDLPSYLKPCFLYLAHFPEDFEIPAQRLLQMWIAEGFILAEDGVILEDIAESYLIELLDRCIIQVGKRHATMRIDTCRIHDLMRDFCLAKAKEESFLYVIDHSHDYQTSASQNYCARRLALHKRGVRFDHMKTPHLRTLMFFEGLLYGSSKDLPEGSLMQKGDAALNTRGDEMNVFRRKILTIAVILMFSWNMRRYISHIFNSFGKLRVLHIQGGVHGIVCNEFKNVGSLIHLRYFSLPGCTVPKWPSSLGKLSCLLTLDLRTDMPDSKLPDMTWRMEQLRHLYFPKRFRCKRKLRLDNLRNLQTLVNFSTIKCHLEDIRSLTNLRELSIRGFTDYTYISNPCLAENCCQFCSYARNFCLGAPEHRAKPNIGLEEDPMPMLGELPNLRILVIEAGAFSVDEMICSAEGFPQLESLTLDSLDKLAELKIAEGAMTDLYHVKIKNCPQLKMLPSGFKSIAALKKVEIEEMPEDFDNWWKN